ncbi:hypothetical protein D1007_33009 [Hordeum vulgare]|uniref:Clp R domain-containing protein n=1 Tax=Hordeum vulgare subsp. vulgare TaxID=112509 RepID=A0A8I6WSK7_HORVV|nr:protein SMAX1-LIKE 4 [Hordeum vulgare subsp. vulgare]KAE8792403.1 hypothetical protein D1007_33009 [Hordeum vulgare]
MRAGAYTIHQSLTAEAAAVLKLAVGLARRRGHGQVTPLHVAFALLSSACSQPLACAATAPAYGLLRRACLRSHSAVPPAQHPLQCRALELCFNVALNRLPTSGPHSPPPSSAPPFASSLIQPNPMLSNALVAALKRAQANQRRGCVELQQPPPSPGPVQHQGAQQQQLQQPVLAVKVELDQLIISILDDPSVSRVMREAGFSSATVKSNLEEESALMMSSSSSSPPPPVIPPHFFLDHSSIDGCGFGMWPAQFLTSPPVAVPCCKEDVRAVLEVMVRKRGRRTNPVVVGDSVSMAEAVAGELLRCLERGEVPEELAGAHLLKLQLSYVHVRLMSRADVDAKAAQLRRSVDAVQRGGLVVYVGDLRWALDEDPAGAGADHTASSYSPVEHMVAELGRLLDDLRARCRVWLVATASYQTYMRCQHRRGQPSLESAWALQAVAVPTVSGTGLALNNLHSSSSPSMPKAKASGQQLGKSPMAMAAEPMALGSEQEDKMLLCSECNRSYEREASVVKQEAGTEGLRCSLPGWLVLDNKPPADHQMPHQGKHLIELKMKWSRLCTKLHLWRSQQHDPCSPSCFVPGLSAPPNSWWPSPCLLPSGQSTPSIAGFLGLEGLMEHSRSSSRWSPPSPLPCPGLMEPERLDVKTTLALGTLLPLSDTATSEGPAHDGLAHELERRLRKTIPCQTAGTVAEIVEAVASSRSYGRKGVCLFFKGSDHAAQHRAAVVIAETCCGSADQIIAADPKKYSCAEDFCSDVVSRACTLSCSRLVLVIPDVEHAPRHLVDYLVAESRCGCIKDHLGRELKLSGSIIIFTTSEFANRATDVISLRLWTSSSPADVKRKAEIEPPTRECKRARHGSGSDSGHGIDLNINPCAGNDTDDDAVPSDITHESDTREHGDLHHLLESVATGVLALDKGADADQRAAAAIREVLVGALGREVHLDDEAAEALTAASQHFLDKVLWRWAVEVFEPAAAAALVENGGKVVVLGMGPGGGAQVSGFMGSALPSRVLVD